MILSCERLAARLAVRAMSTSSVAISHLWLREPLLPAFALVLRVWQPIGSSPP